MKKTILFLSLSLLTLVTFAQSKAEAEIWARSEALSNAVFNTKDSVLLADLVSSAVTYGHSAGNLEDKATMVHKAAVSPTTYKNPSFERVSISVSGNTAVLRHNFRATSVENGAESPLNLGILQVWKKEGTKWRLWARQAFRIAPKS